MNPRDRTPKAVPQPRAGGGTLRRALLCWFTIAFWWLPYRTMTLAQRHVLRALFAAGYLLAVAVTALDGELVLAFVLAVVLAVTLWALRVVDQDLAAGVQAPRSRLNLPSDLR